MTPDSSTPTPAEPKSLLPCPFCGNSARMFPPKPGNVGHRVCCLSSMTCGHRGAARLTAEDAAQAWNTRASIDYDAIGLTAPTSWRCFQCDFVANDRQAALGHFGPPMNERNPSCFGATPPAAAEPPPITIDHLPGTTGDSLEDGIAYLKAAAAEPQQMGTVLINGHRYRRPVITVAVVTYDGASCVVPVHELVDLIGEGTEYTVQIKTMRLAEFERMPEFGGW